MIIDQLPQISLPVLDTDELPVERGEYTYKATVDDIISGSSKVTEITEDLTTFVRPNLLDNWYFVGGGSQQGGGQFPINQRGQTSYSAGYGIDRWTMGQNGTLTINSGYITAANADTTYRRSFGQIIENPNRLRGKTVTATVLLSNGTLVTKSDTIPASVPGSTEYHPTINFSNHTMRCEIAPSGMITFNFMVVQSSSISIVAVKLELGSTQTLAHQKNGVWVLNEIPNFADELARCKRYYNKFPVETYLSGGYRAGEGVIRLTINESVNQNVSLGMSEFYVWTEAGGIKGSYVPTSIARTYWSPTAFTVDITSSFTSAAWTPVTLTIVNGTINADL